MALLRSDYGWITTFGCDTEKGKGRHRDGSGLGRARGMDLGAC
jgi:hypothetical protein